MMTSLGSPIFLLGVLILGVVTTYTDFRYGLIRNKHLLYTAYFGLGVNLYLLFQQDMTGGFYLFLNLLTGIVISLILYATHTWAAGDAKLFMVYCFLMPIGRNSDVVPFNSLSIFINIFVISFFIMIPLVLWERIKMRHKFLWKDIFSVHSLRQLGISLLIMLGLTWIIPHLMFRVVPMGEKWVYFLIMYICYHGLYSMLDYFNVSYRNLILITTFGFIARIYFDPAGNLLDSMRMLVKTALLYTPLFYFIRRGLLVDLNPESKFRFSPVMFFGVLLSNTSFLNVFMRLLQKIRG